MLALLVPGVGMGGSSAGVTSVYVQSIGRKIGIVRPDAPDHNAPTGLSGQVI